MNTDIDGESENQENLDNDAEQTTIKDEINDEYKEYKTSRELFEECLQKSFYETGKQELISIISNKFPKLGRKISSHYEIDTLINIFIDYCASHGEFTVAWSVIKEKRSYWYNDFFPRWSHAVRQEEHIEYGYKNKQRNQQNQDDLVEWFFKLNDPVAQSMVITAALFQGVERNTFNEMALDIYKLLFPPGQEVPKSEPPSGENQENSVQEEKEQQAPPQSPLLKNELEQFQLARLKFILDKRNSHYGLTDVEIVIFEFNNYQTEILKLIKNNLYSKQSDLFEFIRSLVDDRSAEKRLFAVKALIALSETHLFQDLLNSIIRNW
ncbi:MAG: hypothetical protein D3905_12915, partial [Candidatus Electrothrix sp. AS4_5]|nr:hypothetical protein [Candidatus Electrothrix gigas]